jgi:hypothetical protein
VGALEVWRVLTMASKEVADMRIRDGWLSILVLSLCLVSTPVDAQIDCGDQCDDCGLFNSEGREYNPFGQYNMACNGTGTMCNDCPLALNDQDMAATDLAALVLEANSADAVGLVVAYGERLLLEPARGIVVVQGSTCDPEALAAITSVNVGMASSLANAGMRSLDVFLAGAQRSQ